ncbi:unnamed protein product, partial [Prorocentrum cordatum]
VVPAAAPAPAAAAALAPLAVGDAEPAPAAPAEGGGGAGPAPAAEEGAIAVPGGPAPATWTLDPPVATALSRCLQVFTAAFGVAREGDDLRDVPTTGLNELELEEKGAYQAKMGKYATDGLKALRDDGFWLALRVSGRLRGPLDQLLHFTQQSRGAREPQNLALLVWGHANKVRVKLEGLLDPNAWTDILRDVPDGIASKAMISIKQCVLKLLGAFHIRIAKPAEEFPQRLLWLARGAADQPCVERQRLAAELMDCTDPASLRISAATVRKLFGPELKEAATNGGRISMVVYAPFRVAAETWRSDTQEIEGINNILQVGADRAPRISLALLDARACIRKECGLGSRAVARPKWSNIERHVQAIVEDAVQFMGEGDGVLAIKDRWLEPPVVLDDAALTPARPVVGHVDPRMKAWAASYHMHWWWESKALADGADASKGDRAMGLVIFGGEQDDGATLSGWMCCMTYGYVGVFVKVTLRPDVEMKSATVEITRPVQHMISTDLFQRFYGRCRDDGATIDLVHGIAWYPDNGDREDHPALCDVKRLYDLPPLVKAHCVQSGKTPEPKPKPKAAAKAAAALEGGAGPAALLDAAPGGHAAAAAILDADAGMLAAGVDDGSEVLRALESGAAESLTAKLDLAYAAGAIVDADFQAQFDKVYKVMFPDAVDPSKEGPTADAHCIHGIGVAKDLVAAVGDEGMDVTTAYVAPGGGGPGPGGGPGGGGHSSGGGDEVHGCAG